MPIYEYRCSSCGSEHEALQKLSDPPLVTCPSCRKDALTKLVSAAGFQLKGSGWYATDFRNGSAPAPTTAGGDKADTATKPADGAAKPADSAAKPAETPAVAKKPDAPTASAGRGR